jgi:UDP-2,3-diacylglucosamine hydrolase
VKPSRLLIVADAHLGAAPPTAEAAFLEFLDNVPGETDALVMVGDIYDYWFSYSHLVPRRNFRVTAALTTLARRIPVSFVGGNHDRWGDSFWEKDAGIRFSPSRLTLDFDQRSVLVIHGDGLHEERRGAKWMHEATSSRWLIAIYRRLHPDIGFRIADRLGHNLDHGVAHPEEVEAAYRRQAAWARATMAQQPTLGAVIMGHTHRPAVEETAPGQWYINPGAWLDGYQYATLDNEGARLHRFNYPA